MNKAKIVLFFVGVAACALAVAGIVYGGRAFVHVGSGKLGTQYPAPFYISFVLCAASYLTLLFCGVDFLRLRARRVKVFNGVLLFGVVYLFACGLALRLMNMGEAAAAMAIPALGIVLQAATLFPIWASCLVVWAARYMPSAPQPPVPSKAVPVAVIALGAFLALGPLWPRVFNVIILAASANDFPTLLSSPAVLARTTPEWVELMHAIITELSRVGLLACPVGVVVVLAGIVWYIARARKGHTPVQSHVEQAG